MKTLREYIDLVENAESGIEKLAYYYADLYYGDFSSTAKSALAQGIISKIENDEMSVPELKHEIIELERHQASMRSSEEWDDDWDR